jgi:hypothetical protein
MLLLVTLRTTRKKISEQLRAAFAMAKEKSTLQAMKNQKRLNAKPGKRVHVTFEAKDPVLIYELEKYVPQKGEEKPASKLLNRWTGPHTIEKKLSDNKYSVLHASSKRRRELHVNRLYPYQYWKDNTPTPVLDLAKINKRAIKYKWLTKDRYKPKKGELIILATPDEAGDVPFTAAKIQTVHSSGKLTIQWMGNLENSLHSAQHPGWMYEEDSEIVWYYAKRPRKATHRPYTNAHSQLPIHRDNVLFNGFTLTNNPQAPRFRVELLKEISTCDHIDWCLPEFQAGIFLT